MLATLATLPVEVWSKLAALLAPLDLLQFRIIDPKKIYWSKIVSNYGANALTFKGDIGLTTCLTEIKTLRHLTIKMTQFDGTRLLHILPKTLKLLHLEFPLAIRMWLQHPAGSPTPMSESYFENEGIVSNLSLLLPELQDLSLQGTAWSHIIEPDPWSWPLNLRKRFLQNLPCSLTSLHVPVITDISPKMFSWLPPHLNYLLLGPTMDARQEYAHWFDSAAWAAFCAPETLQSLVLHDLHFTQLPVLPRSLESLDVATRKPWKGFFRPISGLTNLQHLTMLTKFIFEALDGAETLQLPWLDVLPQSLTSLSLISCNCTNPDKEHVKLPNGLKYFRLEAGKLEKGLELPETIETLDLVVPSLDKVEDPLVIPANVKRVKIFDSSWLPPMPGSVRELCLKGPMLEDPSKRVPLGDLPRSLDTLVVDTTVTQGDQLKKRLYYWPEQEILALPPKLTILQAWRHFSVMQLLALPKTLTKIAISVVAIPESVVPKDTATFSRREIEHGAVQKGFPAAVFDTRTDHNGMAHRVQIELLVAATGYLTQPQHIDLRGITFGENSASIWLSRLPNLIHLLSLRTPHLRAAAGNAFLNALPPSLTSFIMEPSAVLDVMTVRSLPEKIRIFKANQVRLLAPLPASLENLEVMEIASASYQQFLNLKRAKLTYYQ